MLNLKRTIPGVTAEQYAFTHAKDPERYKAVADLDMRLFTSMSSIHKGEMTYINNSKGVDCDASRADELSRAEMEMRIKIMKFASALKECVPGCQVMGQGAGVAAALCAQKGCASRELPYSALRQALLEQDVILD